MHGENFPSLFSKHVSSSLCFPCRIILSSQSSDLSSPCNWWIVGDPDLVSPPHSVFLLSYFRMFVLKYHLRNLYSVVNSLHSCITFSLFFLFHMTFTFLSVSAFLEIHYLPLTLSIFFSSTTLVELSVWLLGVHVLVLTPRSFLLSTLLISSFTQIFCFPYSFHFSSLRHTVQFLLHIFLIFTTTCSITSSISCNTNTFVFNDLVGSICNVGFVKWTPQNRGKNLSSERVPNRSHFEQRYRKM